MAPLQVHRSQPGIDLRGLKLLVPQHPGDPDWSGHRSAVANEVGGEGMAQVVGGKATAKTVFAAQPPERLVNRTGVHPLAAAYPRDEQRLCGAAFYKLRPDMVHVIEQVFESVRAYRDHPFPTALALYPDGAVLLLDIIDIQAVQLTPAKTAGVGKVDNRIIPLFPAVR